MAFIATPDEIEQVREITALGSISETQTLISALTDEQWARTQGDIEVWEGGIRDDDVEVVGGLLGSNVSANANRLRLCNRVRLRLGLEPLNSFSAVVRRNESGGVPLEICW